MKNYYFAIVSKSVKDNVFDLLYMYAENQNRSGDLALKYLAIEYNYSKYIDALLHGKSASLKRGSAIITLMQGKNVFCFISETEKVITFSLRNKFDDSKVDFISFYYGNPSAKNEIRGVVRTNSDFKPLKTY